MTDERTDPPYDADERTMLLAYLDHHRATLLMKTAGLDAEQLGRTLPPSTMTLGGMLKHCALNEGTWFCDRFAGTPEAAPWDEVDWDADIDWDWHSAVDDSPEQLRELWRSTADRSDQVLADVRAADWVVGSVTTKELKKHALPPYITSRLQQASRFPPPRIFYKQIPEIQEESEHMYQ